MLDPVYEHAETFVNGYAALKQKGLWGYIDLTGEMIVEPQFVEAQSVRKEGIAYVKNADGYWDYLILYQLYYQS